MLRGRVPVLYLIHNVLPHEPGAFDRRVAQWALRPARGFAVLTEHEKARLSLLLPDRKQVLVSRHPVNRQFESDRVEPEAARLKLGIRLDRPVVLFFGFIRPYKGVEFLVDAVGRLRDRGQPVDLLIAGEAWGTVAELRQQVESLGMTDQVRIDNRYIPNEEVGLYFSAADVFVAPYTAGTQSGSLQIAASFSLPVVVTEHLAPGLHGIPADRARVVPAGDEKALAEAIQAMLQLPHVRAKPTLPDDGWDSLTDELLALGGLTDRPDAR
jgi:glycosyltransferase involved in cell wall biosynthesis